MRRGPLDTWRNALGKRMAYYSQCFEVRGMRPRLNRPREHIGTKTFQKSLLLTIHPYGATSSENTGTAIRERSVRQRKGVGAKSTLRPSQCAARDQSILE